MIREIILKPIVQFCLKWLAKLYIYLDKPYVIIIAGTTRRLWAKTAIVEALRERDFPVRFNRKNFNAEIGLPLSILNLPTGERSFRKWFKVIWMAIKIDLDLFKRKRFRTEYLVLEMAIDNPMDMKYLLSIIKPSAAVLTTITMIYQENFEDLDSIAKEYQTLVKALPWNGLLVLNNDDERIKNLGKYFDGRVDTYGFSAESRFQIKNVKRSIYGQEFDIEISKKEMEYAHAKINKFGTHHIYAQTIKEIIKDNFKPKQKDFFDKIAQDLQNEAKGRRN